MATWDQIVAGAAVLKVKLDALDPSKIVDMKAIYPNLAAFVAAEGAHESDYVPLNDWFAIGGIMYSVCDATEPDSIVVAGWSLHALQEVAPAANLAPINTRLESLETADLAFNVRTTAVETDLGKAKTALATLEGVV